ncbi:glycine-rich RNA-binding protein 4, mitochondrial-like [Lotus japonicus]|uniref:glycine-rich RNA-binding protein 4, mitochondrial-like n=1 Tax=Lotus japonicus TaxID=34305 RepID=UPI00259038ED|nr:glycine-rich RNA-binding protein 4, mitochondrial-like [Lotus japonicus]
MGSGFGENSDCGDGYEGGNDEEDGGFRTVAGSGRLGSSKVRVALFVDGIFDSISYHQIRDLFAQFGCLMNVFVQRSKRSGRRFRFAFVCFSSLKAATTAIKRLDGFRLGKACLYVSLAKPPNKVVMDVDSKVYANRLASRVSASGLGASSWRDVVVGLKKDS